MLRQKPWETVVGARWPLKGLGHCEDSGCDPEQVGEPFSWETSHIIGVSLLWGDEESGSRDKETGGWGEEMAAISRVRRWWLRPGRGSRGTPRPRYTRFLQDLDSELPGGPSLDSLLLGEYIRGFARWRAHGHVGSAQGWAFSWLFLSFAAGPEGVHGAGSAVQGVHVFLF